jgi:adenine-specific DNA-methyltransferase
MNQLDLQTPDFTAANIARLAELFPNCATDTRLPDGTLKRAIDFDLLRQELSHDLVEGPQERYRLDWPGKREALALANAPIRKTLRPSREESVNFDTTRNLYLEGDNLDALKLLQETYLGQVKMIYIDPPYNTGNDFIYEDDFAAELRQHERDSGERDQQGNKLIDEERWKQNSSSNGRFHSDWLSMMYSRLKLARNLLRDDGVMLVSIDDCETNNLRKICDEVMGEGNFIASIVWEKGRKNDAKLVSVGHEYIHLYAKSNADLRNKGTLWREEKPGAREIWEKYIQLKSLHGKNHGLIEKDLQEWFKSLPNTAPSKKWSRYKRVDNNGPWRDRDISWPGGGGPRYDVIHPITKKPCAVPERGWIYGTVDEMQKQIKLGLVEFRGDHTEPPFRKAHLRPVTEETDMSDDDELATQVRGSYFYKQSQVSVREFRELMEVKAFENPKDRQEIGRLVAYVGTSDSDIILDFFSGSATTAHAVMQLNAEDGGNRRHIMVQLPEPCDEKSEAFKAGYATIAEIGKERIRRAGQKVLAEWQAKQAKTSSAEGDLLDPPSAIHHPPSPPPDIGFRVLKVDSSNFTDVYYQPDELTQDDLALQVDNLKRGRKPEDLLFQVLLDWGVDLALPLTEEQIAGRRVFFVDGDALAACFETGLDEAFVKALATRAPLRAVFRDAGYASDAVKINIEQIFKALSPHTELKTL